VTSFFGLQCAFFFVFLKRQDESAPNFFFQGLGKNTRLLQHALKSTAPSR